MDKNILQRFIDRPHVFVTKNTYSNYVDFLSGYLFALKIDDDFLSFIKLEYSSEFSVHWSYFLLDVIAESDENKARNILFSVLNKFSSSLKSDQSDN